MYYEFVSWILKQLKRELTKTDLYMHVLQENHATI